MRTGGNSGATYAIALQPGSALYSPCLPPWLRDETVSSHYSRNRLSPSYSIARPIVNPVWHFFSRHLFVPQTVALFVLSRVLVVLRRLFRPPVPSPATSDDLSPFVAATAQTPQPPAIRPSCVRVRRPGPAPALSQPHPAASRSPWPSPISGPSPHHAQPRPWPSPQRCGVRGPWAAPGSVWVRAELEACACAERSSVAEPQKSSRAVPLGLTRVRFHCFIGLRHAPWLRSRNDLGQGGRGGQRVETVSSHYSVDRLSPSNPSSDLSSTPSGNFLSSHLFVS